MSNKKNSDKSRVVTLLIGFLILFVVTFSLGIIVGKGISDRSFKSAQEEVQSGPVFSEEPKIREMEEFQALTQEPPEPSPSPDEPALESAKDEPQEPSVIEEVVEEIEVQVEAPSTPEPETVEIAQVPATPEPVKIKSTPVPSPPEKIRKAAIEEISKTDQNKREGRPKLPPIDPKGRYTVQIGSFTDQKAAQSVLNSMKRKGYPAFINSMTDSDKKRWFRVRIGTFASSQTANEYGESLKVLEPEVKLVFITQNN